MVAILKLLKGQTVQQPEIRPSLERGQSLAKLKALHAEAEETARLANLLGRSGYVGVALPFLGILTMALSVDVRAAAQIVWLLFVGTVAGAMLVAYRKAMKRPFERTVLKDYAKDLSAILLFAGFAWGAGAFLALPAGLPASATIAFATLPALSVAYLLRDKNALALFLAPAAALTAAACLLKPLGGWPSAVGVAAAAGSVIVIAYLYERLVGIQSKPAMLSLP